ncbi:hypothetical protein QJS10_CPB21g00089 [Acorus calamus]|uniref:SUPPRESSOR OF ABI3-5 n=1 Tax=Acorus calamus TaxID=4465 RepID=A0AAV9C7H9_ACOCL|nr:hypothetical protein QJS10_CPB21g00089 [Acorus calamus]
MDPGRYVLQQGWDNNSALEGYGAVHEPDFRSGGSYGDRRLLDEGFSRDPIYSRNVFHRDVLERDLYPPPPVNSMWPQQRRRNLDDGYTLSRDSRRHEKPYVGSFHDMDRYREVGALQDIDKFQDNYGYRSIDGGYRDHGSDRPARFGGRDSEGFADDDYEYHHRIPNETREDSRERDHDSGRYTYDSDCEKRREGSWRRRESREHERWDKDESPHGRQYERSRSRGHDDRSRSRSPRGRSRGRSHREDSFDDSRYERVERRWDRDEKRHGEHFSVAPSATVVVKGLSQKTGEEDLYQILAKWGPLRHVRIIKERNSGVSRGFAFVDFPSVEAARGMMDSIGDDGLVIDGRKLFFEYSSKPTGGSGAPSFGQESTGKPGRGLRNSTIASDWMCTICGCVNFARRTSCFQCSEGRTDDAPAADVNLSNPAPVGKRGTETGPTHVLVVRGLDENADEEMLRYEFSKHAPIKDLRLVRDKFTHVSRGFAFLHFHSVEDATRAMEATNGTRLEKNGQLLRVAYAKSIHGPGAIGTPHSSSLAAAAIEAAAFAQQYDAVGWAPKEYNPDEKQTSGGIEPTSGEHSAPQSGFIWDEKSGYYYDAASGFYYDGNTGLYYDGNTGLWYTFDNHTQQYVPCTNQSDNKASEATTNEPLKTSEAAGNRKVVISAPASTITSNEKTSLPDAVQAAAVAAQAAEKKEKEKLKEIRLASKSSILANKKKMSNVLTMWKQRNHEGQAARVVLDDSQQFGVSDDRQSNSFNSSLGPSIKNKFKSDVAIAKESITSSSGFTSTSGGANSDLVMPGVLQTTPVDSSIKPRPVSNSSGGTIMGVIRGSGKGVVKSDTTFPGTSSGGTVVSSSNPGSSGGGSSTNSEALNVATPFKTDVSALGSYVAPVATGSGKRRFSEMPVQQSIHREQTQTTYRDRAAERRNLYGSTSSVADELVAGDSNHDFMFRKNSSDVTSMPFPPGVGGGRGSSDGHSGAPTYEVITADRAIDESNVGNRMLRNMGWQEGLGLGKDGSGITAPVQAQATDARAGLGSQPRKVVDPQLEAQAGDSYKTIIQKKAIARFREMS